MGEPFTIKDMEATGNVARSLTQDIEKFVTKLEDEVFNSIIGRKKINYSFAQWKRYCTAFMCDEDVIIDFNNFITVCAF